MTDTFQLSVPRIRLLFFNNFYPVNSLVYSDESSLLFNLVRNDSSPTLEFNQSRHLVLDRRLCSIHGCGTGLLHLIFDCPLTINCDRYCWSNFWYRGRPWRDRLAIARIDGKSGSTSSTGLARKRSRTSGQFYCDDSWGLILLIGATSVFGELQDALDR